MNTSRYIIAGKFIDGTGTDIRKNVCLEIKDTLITNIESAANFEAKEADTIDDYSYCIILPALIDCSIRLSQSPSVNIGMNEPSEKPNQTERKATLDRQIQYCHTHGVLGVAESDDILNLLKERTETIPRKTEISIKKSAKSSINAKEKGDVSPIECDFLRINYSGTIEGDSGPHPSKKQLHDILSRKSNKKAVVVANGQQQVKEALEAGCDAIEQGYGMGEDNLRKMARRGVLWIPSVLRAKNGLDGSATGGDVCCRFSQRYVAPGEPEPGAEAYWKQILAKQLAQLQFAKEIGVTTAVGTGAGSIGILHGESVVEEMKLFIKAGYSLSEAIHSASEIGAFFFGMENLGALTIGKKATFLIARGALQQMPRKLSYLEGIFIDGAPSDEYSKNPVKTV